MYSFLSIDSKIVLILDFTKKKKGSNYEKGYFDSWNSLFGIDGEPEDEFELTSGSDLYKAMTTDNNLSLGSYFNTTTNIERKAQWNFGNKNDFIEISDWEYEKGSRGYERYFIDNVFNLGNGINYLIWD